MKYQFQILPEILEAFSRTLNIAIIYSGDNRDSGAVLQSTYHPRFWKSYKEVSIELGETLRELGFENIHVFPDDMRLAGRLADAKIHLAWLNTGGVQGRNAMAHTPGLLDMLGIPFVGHNLLSYAAMDHKLTLKRIMVGLGIATPDFLVWDPLRHATDQQFGDYFMRTLGEQDGPWIVKPVTGRASQYIHLIKNKVELLEAIEDIYRNTYNLVLIEAFLPGKEYCVAGAPYVIHQNGRFKRIDDPFTFSFAQRLFGPGEKIFTSIDRRKLDSSRARLLDDESHHQVMGTLRNMCTKLFREMSLKYLIRLDLREDEHGKIHVLEVNPKPDLKKPSPDRLSLVTLGLEREGMTYQDLILGLLGSFIDYGFTYRPVSVGNLFHLLETQGLVLKPSDPQLIHH